MKQTTKHLICAISLSSLMAFVTLTPAKDYAIIIGCNDYQSKQFNSLQGAANDAKNCDAFLKHNGFYVVTLADNPTCSEVHAAINRIETMLKDGDTLTIFASSHGQNYQKRSFLCFNDTMFDRNGRLMPSTALAVEDLLTIFDQVDLKNLTLILDACRVGSIFDRNNVSERFNLSGSVDLNRNTIIIYGASPGQSSLEDGNRGYFSTYFLEGLTGYADVCNGNIDDLVTYHEAFDYAARRLRETNIPQIPFAEGVWGDVKNAPAIHSSLDDTTKRLKLAERELVSQQEYELAQNEIKQRRQRVQELEKQKIENDQQNAMLEREGKELEKRRLETVLKNTALERERDRLAQQVSAEAKLQRQRQHQLEVQRQQFRQQAARQGARIGIGIALRYIR